MLTAASMKKRTMNFFCAISFLAKDAEIARGFLYATFKIRLFGLIALGFYTFSYCALKSRVTIAARNRELPDLKNFRIQERILSIQYKNYTDSMQLI
jgi:hypothetical protein